MMKRLSVFFYRISTGPVTLSALLVFLIFSSLTLPKENAKVEAYAHGLGSPDTTFFYNGSQIAQMAEVYGEEGRAEFLKARWTFDLAFPFIYTFFYITAVSYCFKYGQPTLDKLSKINLLPLLALLFDLAENTSSSAVMAVYPQTSSWGQALAPIFTPLKWFFVITGLLLVVIGLIRYLIRRNQNKR